MAPLRIIAAWSGGVAAGVGMGYVGVHVAVQPVNPLVVPSLAIDPTSVVLAGVLAAALPALILRCSFMQVVALAVAGGFLCFAGVNFVHWVAFDPPHPRANLSELRDWVAASVCVGVAATLSTGIASRQ